MMAGSMQRRRGIGTELSQALQGRRQFSGGNPIVMGLGSLVGH